MNATAHLRRAIVLVAAASAVALAASPAGAHEPAGDQPTTSSTRYATPLEALDGLTLAQYVGNHVERVLGPTGV